MSDEERTTEDSEVEAHGPEFTPRSDADAADQTSEVEEQSVRVKGRDEDAPDDHSDGGGESEVDEHVIRGHMRGRN